MKMKNIYKIILLVCIVSLVQTKSFLPKNYIDGFTDYNFSNGNECSDNSINCQTTAVLPFEGKFVKSATDYARLYLGKYTDLQIIERDDIVKLLDEQDYYPDRLNEETRAKIKELLGADLLVVGKVWNKSHVSFLNIFLPWRWDKVINKHWYVLIRIVDTETGQIYSNYYSRDGHGIWSLGLQETFLSESIESLVVKLTDDGKLISSAEPQKTDAFR